MNIQEAWFPVRRRMKKLTVGGDFKPAPSTAILPDVTFCQLRRGRQITLDITGCRNTSQARALGASRGHNLGPVCVAGPAYQADKAKGNT